MTWTAAVVALLVGVAMVYLPYEFQASVFRGAYPYLRLLGLGFFFAGLGLAIGAAYPTSARWADLIGRATFLGVLGVYWWDVAVVSRSLAGMVFCPLLMICVAAEAHPRLRRGGLFPYFLAAVGVAFGVVIQPLGSLWLAAAICLIFVLRKPADSAERVVLGVFAVLFGGLSYSMASEGSWAGMVAYAIECGACVATALRPTLRNVTGVRSKVLRDMAVAGLVPLLAVGGLASYLAQSEIETTLRERGEQAASVEAEWVAEAMDLARDELHALRAFRQFQRAVADGNAQAVKAVLDAVRTHEPLIDGLFIQNVRGVVWIGSAGMGGPDPLPWQDEIDDGLIAGPEPFVSRPFWNVRGMPSVAMAIPLNFDDQSHGTLIGTLTLDRLTLRSDVSRPYRAQLIDARDGMLLRDSAGVALLQPVALGPNTGGFIASRRIGTFEVFDDIRERALLAHAPVRGTPWVFVANQSLHHALAPVTRVSVAVAAIVVIAAALAMALSSFLGREFISRIGAVRDAAAALADGNLAVRATDGREQDELGTLARVFNRMADRLQSDQAQLAHVNEELHDALDARDGLMRALHGADRRKDEFLAMLGHELRNPLAALSTALQVLDARTATAAEDAGRIEMHQIARRQLTNLVRLVDDLLDVSRITSGRIELRKERVDLRRAVGNALATMRAQNVAKGHDLRYEAPSTQLWVEGDPTRLEQIFTNLLSNAIKYTDAGGSIAVRVTQTDGEEPAQAVVEVSDTGRGIPGEDLPYLFDPFVQGETALHRNQAGLGLGLTLVRTLARLHGGSATCDSEGTGRGSTFTVRLPLAAAAEDAQAAPVTRLDEASPGACRIVLVDDNEDAAVAFKELLEDLGHEVEIAHDGEEGRDLILKSRPAVAFVDLGLPKIDGYQVAREIREARLDVAIRLVALTGYGGDDVRARALAAGFEKHLTKPFDLSDLTALLNVS